MEYFYNASVFLTGVVQNEPMIVIKWIADFLGAILNFIYLFVSGISEAHALGFSIILLTIITRVIMLPLAIKSQKSLMKTQQLTPEVEKIKKKYGNTKDPELMKKMNQEIQTLYAKEGANPLTGCLPMFIQLPIFFALSYIMQQPFLYIKTLRDFFDNQLSTTVFGMFESSGGANGSIFKVFNGIALPKVPANMIQSFKLDNLTNISKVLNKFTPADWTNFFNQIPAGFDSNVQHLHQLLEKQQLFYTFWGLNLTENAGLSFPGILIPVITVAVTFLSSYLTTKMQKTTSTDSAVQTQQRVMLIMMPLMMGYFVINTPVGVGLYWITSSAFQVVQQLFMNKFYDAKKGD